MAKKYSPSIDLLLPSANIIRQNIGTYFVLSVLPILLTTYGAPSEINGQTVSPIYMLGLFLSLAFLAPLTYTLTLTAKNKEVGLAESLQGFKYFWRLIGLSILIGLAVIIGLILFIIPGFIMLRRYFLAPYVLIDKNLSIKEAMAKSAQITKKNSWAIYGIVGINSLFLLLSAISIVGMIAGSILIILYSVAPALRYQEMK